MGRKRRRVYDPVSRKMVKVRPIQQQMGGPVTRDGQPVDKSAEPGRQELIRLCDRARELSIRLAHLTKDMPRPTTVNDLQMVIGEMAMSSSICWSFLRERYPFRVINHPTPSDGAWVVELRGIGPFRVLTEEALNEIERLVDGAFPESGQS